MKKTDLLNKQKSSIHGFGVFIMKPVKKGHKIYKVSLDRIVSKPHKTYAKIGENKFVSDPILNWVNHSCNPSVRFIIETKEPHLIALRDIAKGEEITCDYNETEVGGNRVKCNCENKDCTGYFLRVG